jgi:hypothetical protein
LGRRSVIGVTRSSPAFLWVVPHRCGGCILNTAPQPLLCCTNMTNAQSVFVYCRVESSDPRQMLVILRVMQNDEKVYTDVAPNRQNFRSASIVLPGWSFCVSRLNNRCTVQCQVPRQASGVERTSAEQLSALFRVKISEGAVPA